MSGEFQLGSLWRYCNTKTCRLLKRYNVSCWMYGVCKKCTRGAQKGPKVGGIQGDSSWHFLIPLFSGDLSFMTLGFPKIYATFNRVHQKLPTGDTVAGL